MVTLRQPLPLLKGIERDLVRNYPKRISVTVCNRKKKHLFGTGRIDVPAFMTGADPVIAVPGWNGGKTGESQHSVGGGH